MNDTGEHPSIDRVRGERIIRHDGIPIPIPPEAGAVLDTMLFRGVWVLACDHGLYVQRGMLMELVIL